MTSIQRSVFVVPTLLYLYLYQVFGLPVSQLLGGNPLPPSALTVRSAIACEGQKAFVSCDNVYSGIQIKSTMYGRRNSSICVDPKRSSSSFCQEQEPEIEAQVRDLCEDEHKCEVTASDALLAKAGTVVCPTVSKYLKISYRCIPKGISADVEQQDPQEEQTVSEVVSLRPDQQDESAIQDDMAAVGPLISPSPPVTRNKLQSKSDNHVTEILQSSETSPSDDDVTETFSGNLGGDDFVKEVHETVERSRIEPKPSESGDGFESEIGREVATSGGKV